jgi:hypothetical protein
MFKPGKPVHPAFAIGTAPDAAATPGGVEISFDMGSNRDRQSTSSVIITNMEAAGGNTLEVSFADGAKDKWFAVATQHTLAFPVCIHRCRLRGTSGATADYSIMGVIS